MKQCKFAADYQNFRFSKLNTPEFSHLWLLIYWPIYGLAFLILERALHLDYHSVYCLFDNYIPFCEFFVIPYYFWFMFLIGMILYSVLFNIDTFKRYMFYTIITYTITLIIYLIYPTKQDLRPINFERSNLFVTIVTKLYNFDTNTNVCPSLHVIGSFAVLFSAWNDKKFQTLSWRVGFIISTVLISLSTVFLKQHSIIDVVLAVVLSFICYPLVFGKKYNLVKKWL